MTRSDWRRCACLALALLLAAVVSENASAQEWRGTGRMGGLVTDEQGNPIAGCKVVLKHFRYRSGPELETDAEGRWSAATIRGGMWAVDFLHPEYQPYGISVNVSEVIAPRPIEVTLKPAKVAVDGSEEAAKEIRAAEDLYSAESYQEALEAYRALAEKYTGLTPIRIRAAECLVGLEQYDEALALLEEILEEHPDDPGAITAAGNAAFKKGDNHSAAAYYTKLSEMAPDDAGVWNNLGEISLNNQDYAKAKEAYSKAIELRPDYYDIYVQLSVVQMIDKDYEAAIRTLETLKEKAPADHPIFSTWNVDELIAQCKLEMEQK